jgi:hypothetical protein
LTHHSRSNLFRSYNAARTLARQGLIEKGRLDRALGLAQSKPGKVAYLTTATSCTCPDAFYRGAVCKHRLAFLLTTSTPPSKTAA